MKKCNVAIILCSFIALSCTGIGHAAAAESAASTGQSEVTPLPQVYKYDQQIQGSKEKAGNGTGTLLGHYAFQRTAATKEQAIKEIAWLTLMPGNSIGLHKHINNDDTYIIVSGTGTFTDSAGNQIPVSAGDVTIARPGQSHGLANTGKEPLVFIDVIAQNDTYVQNHPEAVK